MLVISPNAVEVVLSNAAVTTPALDANILPTTVNPVPALSPYGIEIMVPFQIDPITGGVAELTDELSILNQHLATIVSTELGERLMLPAYGSNVPSDVFASTGLNLDAFIMGDLQ
jgi:hypothetical protein